MQCQREAREYDAYLRWQGRSRSRVDACRLGRTDDEVEAEFAARRAQVDAQS